MMYLLIYSILAVISIGIIMAVWDFDWEDLETPAYILSSVVLGAIWPVTFLIFFSYRMVLEVKKRKEEREDG